MECKFKVDITEFGYNENDYDTSEFYRNNKNEKFCIENCCLDCNNGDIVKCNDIEDCYYKQLIRLEQENETLNYQWHKQSEIGDEWYKIAEKYKHALEEIKKLTIIGINASQCNCGLRALADDILQIITEAKGE